MASNPVIHPLGDVGVWVEDDDISELVTGLQIRATATVGAGDALTARGRQHSF